jgi:hypothetical protein
MRQSGANGRGLSTGDPTRRVSTGGTRIVLLAVIGLLLAVLSPLVVTASPTSAATAAANTLTFSTPVQLSDIGLPSALSGVSCSDATDCLAVGGTVRISESSGSWGPVAPLSDGPYSVTADGVSCYNALNCTIIGTDANGGVPTEITENNGVWESAGLLPAPTGCCDNVGSFAAVSSSGITDSTAVGADGGSSGFVPLYSTETNGLWSTPSTLTPGGWLFGVSCTAPGDCTAVGRYGGGVLPGATYVPDYTTQTNGVWGPLTEIADVGQGQFNSVSCASVGNCTAVGSTIDGFTPQPIAATETNGIWGPAVAISGSLGGLGSLASVSCTSAGNCVAVGSDGNSQPIYVNETSGSWSTISEDLGATGDSGSFSSVSCTSATVCTAVGTDGAGNAIYATSSAPPPVVTPPVPVLPTPPPPPTPTPTPTPPPVVTSPTSTASHGYWLVGSDGGIFTFGDAQFYGSTGNLRLQRPVVSITPTSNDGGYWLVASDGGIFSFGDAGFYGSIPGLGLAPAGSGLPHRLNAPIVGMVPSADGGGYFMVGADGGVFTFGDAKYEGSCPGIGGCPGGAAVAVMPDATGNGYWVVTAGGYVIPFGDAASPGEPGPLSESVVSAVRSYDGNGYYLLYSNGVVYNFGDALNYGSANGEVGGFNPATTIFTTANGNGYWIVSANGSVITEGDAPYEGGANSLHLNGAIIAGTGW